MQRRSHTYNYKISNRHTTRTQTRAEHINGMEMEWGAQYTQVQVATWKHKKNSMDHTIPILKYVFSMFN